MTIDYYSQYCPHFQIGECVCTRQCLYQCDVGRLPII